MSKYVWPTLEFLAIITLLTSLANYVLLYMGTEFPNYVYAALHIIQAVGLIALSHAAFKRTHSPVLGAALGVSVLLLLFNVLVYHVLFPVWAYIAYAVSIPLLYFVIAKETVSRGRFRGSLMILWLALPFAVVPLLLPYYSGALWLDGLSIAKNLWASLALLLLIMTQHSRSHEHAPLKRR